MKVQPFDQKKISQKQTQKETKKVLYLKIFIWKTANVLGLAPFKIDKETHLLSFKWFSTKTALSLLRLVLFNSVLTILPVVLFLLNYKEEWGEDKPSWMGGDGNETSISTQEVVTYGEYVCNYSYYILSQLQKVRATIKLYMSN